VNYESGSTVFSDIANFPYESTGAIKIVSVPGIGMVKDTADIAKGINAVISTGRTLQKVDSGIQNMKKAAELAQQGLGTPQLSPSTSGTSWSSDQNKKDPMFQKHQVLRTSTKQIMYGTSMPFPGLAIEAFMINQLRHTVLFREK